MNRDGEPAKEGACDRIQDPTAASRAHRQQEFFSIGELAERWRCSRGTVYNRLRAVGAKVLDFAPPGKRGKKIVSIAAIAQIEANRTKRLY
jgi:hypothetical protein